MDWLHCADVHVHGCVFSCCPCTFCPRLCCNVCQRPFLFRSLLPLCRLVWPDCSSHLVSIASITFQSECCVLRGGACKLVENTVKDIVSVLLWTRLIRNFGEMTVLWILCCMTKTKSYRTYMAQAQTSSNPSNDCSNCPRLWVLCFPQCQAG